MLTNEEIKKTGSIYTPNALGEYMANKMFSLLKNNLDQNKIYKILDPACGTGDLLEATVNVALKLGIKIEVFGFDVNASAIKKAEKKMSSKGINSHFFQEDFLEFAIKNACTSSEQKLLFDFCIANPPYVRTEILGDEYSQQLSKTFHITGKIDIYQAFYAAIPMMLNHDGIFSVITSNKFLTNKTGKSIRQLLLNEFMLSEVIDLGDTKLFDASVLPAIIVGVNKKIEKQKSINCVSIYQETMNIEQATNKYENIYDLLYSNEPGYYNIKGKYYYLEKGVIVLSDDANDPWSISTIDNYNWTKTVDKVFHNKISDFGKVRVGIKTTADKVFLNQGFDGYTIERDLLHPLFTSEYASKWNMHHVDSEIKKILYPMTVGTGRKKAEPILLENYPETSKYLFSYFDVLNSRTYLKKSNRKWFEIWVPQDPSLWKYNKLIWPDISDEPKFLFDDNGLYVDGNCYWFIPNENENEDLLYLILGVCNSNFMKKYHSIRFQNKLYSNKYRYISQYVSKYPIPNIHNKESQQIIETVKKILSSGATPELEENIEYLLERMIELHYSN